jgi:multiple sugar transport system ATP-binding protein
LIAVIHIFDGRPDVRQRSCHRRFERKVDVVEPTGPDTLLVFSLGGIEAIARVRPEERVPEGSAFRFEVNMDKAKLFDAETGLRL